MEQKSPSRRPRRARSRAWLARLERVESPDVTFLGERFPVVLERGRGMAVLDVDGNRYLDFTACFGVLALGHRPPAVASALMKQASRLLHGMGDVHPTASKVRLLELLARVTPFSRARTVLSLSGGEAVESALKTALLATGRHRFVSFRGGYHGLHMGPLTLNDRATFTRGFEGWIGMRNVQIPFPWTPGRHRTGPMPVGPSDETAWLRGTHDLLPSGECLTLLEDALRTREFAALVMEPLQGRGGERTWPEGFVKEAAALARRYGTLLVFDEIYTGFGRTGPLFALEHHGVVPDLLCLGKALGGGLPLSACVGEAELFDAWGKSTGEARHTSTFLGHPLACATGVAAIRTIVENLPAFRSTQAEVAALLARFAAGRAASPATAARPVLNFEVRGEGAMRGLWFYAAAPGFAAGLAEELLESGFLVLPSGPRGDVLSFTPPLVATLAHWKRLLAALDRILDAHAAGHAGDASHAGP